MISLRLADVLEDIIEPDQTCSVPNRSIITNGLLLRDLIQIANEKNLPAALISLHQLKAFDRINWDFLFQTTSAFNFHPTFVSWMMLLYTDISSCVRMNGHLTGTFSLTMGVWQGCPHSPCCTLFLRKFLWFLYGKIPTFKVFLSLPAWPIRLVNTQTILRSVVGNKSINEIFSTVTLFEQASGARISLQKCEGLWLGSNRGWPGQPHNIRWTSRKIKIIRYHFGNVDTTHDNWDEKIFKFNPWKTRDLSLRGRSLPLNQLAVSKLWYTASIYPLPPVG